MKYSSKKILLSVGVILLTVTACYFLFSKGKTSQANKAAKEMCECLEPAAEFKEKLEEADQVKKDELMKEYPAIQNQLGKCIQESNKHFKEYSDDPKFNQSVQEWLSENCDAVNESFGIF